jgi:class 3 adenylate cyclase
MERRLAAMLAADVVSYSRLMEADETATFERLRTHRKKLLDLWISDQGRSGVTSANRVNLALWGGGGNSRLVRLLTPACIVGFQISLLTFTVQPST